ncbi:MAG: hypothetical protein LZ169_06085 [Thaumarchaeota archaeon]|nr:hypothetical protein [Candidatus Wolframiiraptor allenii]
MRWLGVNVRHGRIMGWGQLIEYLGDIWEELWDATLFKLKAAEMSTP